MTTEVVVMNRVAVAMAADSAVTVTSQIGNKIYNTANKLFALSRHCPVGIMVYGSAELMDMPWEVIIKLYRDNLGTTTYETLNEYAQSFMEYLQGRTKEFFVKEHQDLYFEMMVTSTLEIIKQDTEEALSSLIVKGVEINKKQKNSAIKIAIGNLYQRLKNTDDLVFLPDNHAANIISVYGDLIKDSAKKKLEGYSLSNTLIKQIQEIIVFIGTKNVFSDKFTGIVFAGFGEREFFPSMASFKVDSVINNHLKYIQEEVPQITFINPVAITSFAQYDMVISFIKGIHPEYDQRIWEYISAIFKDYPKSILDSIPQISNEDKASLLNRLENLGKKMLEELRDGIREFQQTRYIDPIVNNVSFLPISELASMAESLVNITSFKRRVSSEEETVGGPIDVAVISKKDGFIWIKRKHYFTPDLNQDYFARQI